MNREFQSRWGLATIQSNKTRYTRQEILAYMNRAIRRMNKAAGYDTAKKESKWFYGFPADNGEDSQGTVMAFTRSEARAKIKKVCGWKGRLPVDLFLEKVDERTEGTNTSTIEK